MSDIVAAVIREWHVGLKTPQMIIQHMVAPLLYLLLFAPAMAATLEVVRWREQDMPYLAFVIPGLMAFTTVAIGNGVGISVFIDRLTGELETLFALPIRRAALLVGWAVNAAVRASIVGAGIWTVAALMTEGAVSVSPLRVLAGIALLAVSATGWTMIAAAISCIIRSQGVYNIVVNLLQLPLMLTASVLYNPAQGPLVTRALAQINPLSFAADGLRSIMLGTALTTADLGGLAVFTGFAIAAAIFAIDRAIQ